VFQILNGEIMTLDEAIYVLDQVGGAASLNRAGHVQVQQAIKLLTELIVKEKENGTQST